MNLQTARWRSNLPDAKPPIDEAEVRVRICTGGGESIPAVRRGVMIAPIGMGIARVVKAADVVAAAIIAMAVIDTGYLP